MKVKSLFAVLSMFMILLLFVSSASAADANTTDVLSVDESVNLENNTIALDSASNDNKVVENDENILAMANNDVSNENILKDETHTIKEFFDEINNGLSQGGYVKLKYDNYAGGERFSPYLFESGTIDGNGATIDMTGFKDNLLYSFGDITIKNLNVKNFDDSSGVFNFGSGFKTIEIGC